MMLTVILADHSKIRVESCPVPVLVDFPEWRIYAHNIITEDGVDESRWVATEARTGHSLPGEYDSSEAASLAAMATLRRWRKQPAAKAFARARKALGQDFPLNTVPGPMPAPKKPEYQYGPRKQPPERTGTIWAACRDVLQSSCHPMSATEVSQALPQFTMHQICGCLYEADRQRTGRIVRCGGKPQRYWLPGMEARAVA